MTAWGNIVQRALRPYLPIGIVAVGVGGLIAATPAAPVRSDVVAPSIQLTADAGALGDVLSDAVTPYLDIFTNTFDDLESIVGQRLADPAPILSAFFDNQADYLEQILADPASITDVPGAIAGHLEAVFTTLTTLVAMNFDAVGSVSSPATLDVMLGVPIALAIGGLAPLLAPVDAIKDTLAALTSGDPTTALVALADAPAVLADDILGGLFRPELDVSGLFTIAQVEQMNAGLAEIGQPLLPVADYDASTGGVGGLVDTLVNYVPQQVAAALSGQTPEIVIGPVTAILGALSALLSETPTGTAAALAGDLVPQLSDLMIDPLSAISF